MSELINSLNWRYAVKKFNPDQQIPESEFDQLMEATRLSASSYGLEPYAFVIVRDPEVRAKLQAASYGQPQIADASHMVVFASRIDMSEADTEKYMQRIAKTRSIPRESLDGFANSINVSLMARPKEQLAIWASRQSYLAVGFLLSAAAVSKIDACPMEGFAPAQYDEILGLKEKGLTASVVVTLGYRSEEDGLAKAPKVRTSPDELFIEI